MKLFDKKTIKQKEKELAELKKFNRQLEREKKLDEALKKEKSKKFSQSKGGQLLGGVAELGKRLKAHSAKNSSKWFDEKENKGGLFDE